MSKFIKTRWGSKIIKDQMDLIRKLSGLDVRLDLFGDIGEKNDIWLAELNFYIKDYPKNDEFKGQRKFATNIDCGNETEIIFSLQTILEALYATKYKEPIPRVWYFPNTIPDIGSERMTKKMKKTLKDSVLLNGL